MRAIAETTIADGPEPESYFDGAPGDMVLVGIGEELRGAYGDLTDSEQPEHLVDLAQRIDALIADGSA